MDNKIDNLIGNFKKRNIRGIFCRDKDEAVAELLRMIPSSASIGMSGSVTLEQVGIIGLLEERGNKVFNQYKSGFTREEVLEVRRQGASADYYLASANAVSQNGELVFFSGYGQRTAGISCAKKAVIICGINKIASDITGALKRAREYATPLNCKRLDWNTPCFKDGVCQESICLFPEYKRMCCQLLIIEAEISADRLTVVLVNENLGF
ncbi:MAG: lactate utilization protein [Candidatus Omnitrophica bacterium]|nr:lactate utilization protein [Candidatus Omnitrophota bacterium]